MPNNQVKVVLRAYAKEVRDQIRANPDIAETGMAPRFQRLVEDLLPHLPAVPSLAVSPEYNKPGVGRPDIALILTGQPPRAFIELKALSKFADPTRWATPHDRRQFERLKELSHWASCNFAEFRLFSRDEELGNAQIVPAKALKADCSDAKLNSLVDEHDEAPFVDLLARLCRADAPSAESAPQLAELMAHSARIVRSAVFERIGQLREEGKDNDPLMMVRSTFKDVLYAHPEAGGYAAASFDELFSSAFAQTLAFGLLLVREAIADNPEITNKNVGVESWKHMPDEHPLMKAALRVLSEEEVTRQIGIGFDVMCDTVNSFAPKILAVRKDGYDPILYFYEDFLKVFDPAARDKYGVYYTPVEVVRYMASALDRALSTRLGTKGLIDPDVTILDPATGTGTFLLGIAERVRDCILAEEGGAAASMALSDLSKRMYGFELLVGPYAVAHYRLHHALRYRPADDLEDAPQLVNLPRLGIYLADTLAEPHAMTTIGSLGIQGIPIDEERAEANRIKTEQPILAIIGNPPYKRLEEGENETLVGRWMDNLWDDLKAPVRNAGQGGQLNTFPEFSVAFWRWAMWKLFEADNAPNKGVIAFISNRKFLTGWPYAGLRKMMRERFDRIEVIDLRGDVRAGTRGDVDSDQGVFNIMVGTAITVAIADGSKDEGELAEVVYADCWREEIVSRRRKLDWLFDHSRHQTVPDWERILRDSLEDWKPKPFQNGELLSIVEVFVFKLSGMQTKRDELVYHPDKSNLEKAIRAFLALDLGDRTTPDIATALFHESRDRKWRQAHAVPFDQSAVKAVSYRPLDGRYLYNRREFGDFLRPNLQEAWGGSNACLYTMPSGVGSGPATWCHGDLPDYHAFRGSYGGFAFPLYDRRVGPTAHNLSPVLMNALAAAYGAEQSPQDVFDVILCLLSARSYTRRFAEDLEDVFPHVPFPADPDVFAKAATIGAEIRGLEAFQREPATGFRPLAFARIVGTPAPDTIISDISYVEGQLCLWKDGAQPVPAFTGLPEAVWSFSVSGYRVLPRWIEGRKGLPVTLSLLRELRDVAARIHELLHWFEAADLVLEETLDHTLTREELGFPSGDPEELEEGDD
jgi:hypothetical protein